MNGEGGTVRTWRAEMIGADLLDVDRLRPIRFRNTFTVTDVPAGRLTMLATACGVYRAFLNSRPVGDHVLAPGWTSYHHRHFVQSFDVSDLLVEGDNVIGIEVAEGWYRGRLGWFDGVTDTYGTELGAFAELHAEATSGSTVIAGTGTGWTASPSATLTASLYDGEAFDQRLDDRWTSPGFDATTWSPTRVLEFDTTPLLLQTMPPIRRIEEIAPVSISTSPQGRTLVDFGQNVVGRVRLRLPAVADATITLRHAEVLEDGELGLRPLRAAKARDTVHLSGAGGEWEPAFTFHGFRYVAVQGWPGELTTDDLRAVVCHTDLTETGSFECSNDLLNQLHANVRWGAKGNLVSVPTDCPQRDERLGWTGDIQVFAPTAAFLFDCRSMLASWLQDLAAEQRDHDGVVPVFVPGLQQVFGAMPAAGWGDAAVIVPWVLYERFGDLDVLAAQYDSMCSWIDAIAVRSRPNGLWQSWQFGDWLDPSAPPNNPAKGRTDGDLVAAAYQVHTTRIVARAASLLDRADDAQRFAARAKALLEALVSEYVTPNGRVTSDSQTAYALALVFDLLTPPQRSVAGRRLRKLVEADGFCIGTGFLGTPIVCDALADSGSPDHAYRLLTQTECPSWLYPVTMGATTIWERWDSMLPDGSINPGSMTSFNHYAFGAVADFLHRRVAGLAPGSPGYETIDVRPLVGGGLTWASARHRTPRGEAAVRWERDGDRFAIEVTVPAGATARIHLPDGSDPIEVAEGTHRQACAVRPASDDPINAPVA